MSNRGRWWIVVLSLVGVVAAGTSTYTHFQLVRDPGYTAFCDVSATVSCAQVYQSRFGSVQGVPVALAGVLWFLLVLLLAFADARVSERSQQNIGGYLLVWSTLGLAIAMYMAYASFFVLQTICLMCSVVYTAVIGIFILTGTATATPMTQLPAGLAHDLGQLMRRPVGLSIAVLFLVSSAASVILFSRPQPPLLVAEPTVPTDEQGSEFDRWWEAQPRIDSPVAEGTAKVVVVKFNDYQCPACADTYLAYQPIFAKYASSDPDDVRVVTLDYPLDPECNDQSPNGPHTAACEAAVAVRLANAVGFVERERMERWLFSNQKEMSADTIKAALLDISGVGAETFDARYDSVIAQVKEDIALGATLPVEATPTFVINGVMLKGGLNAQYFDQAIDYELARAEESL
jgi:uncharacterized membrane protein/protein-disulfide isomerase